jgi:hypothetical protein
MISLWSWQNMNKCKNPECGKEVPAEQNYCNEDCLRRHQQLKREAKESEKSKGSQVLDTELKGKLNNTAWQRGLSWRTEKIEAIAEARRRSIDEVEIFKQLKRAGLIDQTARALMNDAHYFDE